MVLGVEVGVEAVLGVVGRLLHLQGKQEVSDGVPAAELGRLDKVFEEVIAAATRLLSSPVIVGIL